MFDQVSPARLDAYKDKIDDYNTKYGSQMWSLIYQADMRARQEQTERLRRKGVTEHNEASQSGKPHPFDSDRPWEWVFHTLVLDDRFWKQELEDPALLVTAKSISLMTVVEEPAPAAMSLL